MKFFIIHLFFAFLIKAQSPLPKEQIPDAVAYELENLDRLFTKLLIKDCPDLCFPKGCSYMSHELVFKKSSSQLPGIDFKINSSVNKDDAQSFLTAALCEYSYESFMKDDLTQKTR